MWDGVARGSLTSRSGRLCCRGSREGIPPERGSLWGRTGFDEGNEIWSACRGCTSPLQTTSNATKANDNVDFALAA